MDIISYVMISVFLSGGTISLQQTPLPLFTSKAECFKAMHNYAPNWIVMEHGWSDCVPVIAFANPGVLVPKPEDNP